MSRFSRLIESQIRKAQAEGQFDDLEGAGKPLPKREGEAHQDVGMEVGLRAMAEAGVIPEEIQFKKWLHDAYKRYRESTDEAEKKAIMKEIADLSLKYEIARDARVKFFR